MTLIIDEELVKEQRELMKDYVLKGKVLIYPTDTVYGLGCDATNEECVKKIKDIKRRSKVFSVIAPSKEWIMENFEFEKEYLELLPGPYTLIMKMKKQVLPEELFEETVGVRIPDHWISDFVNYLQRPIVTTSANLTGEDTIKNLDEAKEELLGGVDLFINARNLKNKPSKVINTTTKEVLRE